MTSKTTKILDETHKGIVDALGTGGAYLIHSLETILDTVPNAKRPSVLQDTLSDLAKLDVEVYNFFVGAMGGDDALVDAYLHKELCLSYFSGSIILYNPAENKKILISNEVVSMCTKEGIGHELIPNLESLEDMAMVTTLKLKNNHYLVFPEPDVMDTRRCIPSNVLGKLQDKDFFSRGDFSAFYRMGPQTGDHYAEHMIEAPNRG